MKKVYIKLLLIPSISICILKMISDASLLPKMETSDQYISGCAFHDIYRRFTVFMMLVILKFHAFPSWHYTIGQLHLQYCDGTFDGHIRNRSSSASVAFVSCISFSIYLVIYSECPSECSNYAMEPVSQLPHHWIIVMIEK